MTLQRMQANRLNSRKSTGPRSATGKAAASRNALRHGLNVALSERSPAVGNLAERLAGEFAKDDLVHALALRAARAILSYHRVQGSYAHLYEQLAAPVKMASPSMPANDLMDLQRAVEQLFLAYAPREDIVLLTVPDLAKALDRLERYERRAFSARASAIKNLDAVLLPLIAESVTQASI